MTESLTLYVVPASHPCVAVMAVLDLKGLDYERVDLAFGASNIAQVRKFGSRTVPALEVGRQKVSGSRLIMRTLEGLQPEPSIVPSDPDLLAKVNEADIWADRVLQDQTRWIVLNTIVKRPEAMRSYAEGYKSLQLPDRLTALFAGPGVRIEGGLLGHGTDRVRDEYMPALPGHLDHVDTLIADGVLGGDQPNVAAFQIAASVRLLMTLEDLRPGIVGRPCGELAERLIPDYAGSVPAGTLEAPAGLLPAAEAGAVAG